MLGECRRGRGDAQGHLETLLQAKELQEVLVARTRTDPDKNHEHVAALAETCVAVADRYAATHDFENAAGFYGEAMKHDAGCIPAMLALAKLRLNAGDQDGCQKMCANILRRDAENEEATTMLAELLFQRERHDAAIHHFQELLEKRPDNYRALAQLVRLLRKSGRRHARRLQGQRTLGGLRQRRPRLPEGIARMRSAGGRCRPTRSARLAKRRTKRPSS